MGKTAPGIPTWAQTIGGIHDAGGVVQAWCDQCKASVLIDLPALIEKVGRDYSLVDRRCPCRITQGCVGWNQFRYASGPHAVRWNLRTEAGLLWRSEREWALRRAIPELMRARAEFNAEKKRKERR